MTGRKQAPIVQWVLVADAAQARLFRRDTDADPLVQIDTVAHPATHLRPSAGDGDRPGHGSSDRHVGGVSFEPRVEPHRKEHRRFARELAERLERAAERREYARLSIYAPPEFLGDLRAELGAATRQRLGLARDLDLCAYGLDELEKRIAQAEHEARRSAPT